MSNLRIAVLFNRVGPYHHARLTSACRLAEVVAVEFSGVDKVYMWDQISPSNAYDRQTVFSDSHIDAHAHKTVTRKLTATLSDIRPDVVAIPGWASRGALTSLQWCLRSRTPTVLMADSWSLGKRHRWWRQMVKKRIVQMCSAALVAGAPHVEFIRSLGMPRESIFMGYDTVDNEYFRRGAVLARRQEAGARRRLNLPDDYFLCVSRFVREKNLARLLHAYASYVGHIKSGAWKLVLVGDGPLRDELHSLRTKLGLTGRVQFVGYEQYSVMPMYYGLAKAFVLASVSETWGLAVNEAMASGLPVLVSKQCGCAKDLVRDGWNGYTFDPYQVDTIRDALIRITSQTDRSTLGGHSQQLIDEWGPDRFGTALVDAASAANEIGARNGGAVGTAVLDVAARRKR